MRSGSLSASSALLARECWDQENGLPDLIYNITQQAFVDYDSDKSVYTSLLESFEYHLIQDVLATVSTLRPTVEISLAD